MSRVRTWRVTLDDGLLHAVEAHGFHEDGKFTVFTVPEQSPVFATLTDRIVSISREPDGEKSLHKLGYPPLTDMDEPAKMLREPHVGEFVHGVTDVERACRRAVITAVDPNDGLFVDLCVLHENGPYFKSRVMLDQRFGYWDVDRKTYRIGTWHWPCDGNERPAEPGKPAPTAFTINIQGNTLAECELRNLVAQRLRDFRRDQ